MTENRLSASAPLHVPFRGGRGEPLVMLHGVDSVSREWRPAGVALAKNNEVAIVDLLGFGASPAPAQAGFTLEEHSAAVWATIEQMFGTRPVRIVGHGVGASIALACAAQRPAGVSEVIAFSPVLVPMASGSHDADLAAAELQRSLAELRERAGSRWLQALAAESLEADLTPRIRSLEAVLGLDAGELLARVTARAVIVVPDADPMTPAAWLRAAASGLPGFSVIDVEGRRTLPFDSAAAAVRVIDPTSEEVQKAARREAPAEVRPARRVDHAFGGAASLLARRFLLMAVLGITVITGAVPVSSYPTAFSLWLLLEALQTVATAFGQRRRGRPWLGWAFDGVVSFSFALYLTAVSATQAPLPAPAVAAWLVARGSAELLHASREPLRSSARWPLTASALVALASAAVAVMVREESPLLAYALGGYLLVAATLFLMAAVAIQRVAATRLRELAR